MKSFFPKIIRTGRIHHGDSLPESCPDCEKPDDTAKPELAVSGSEAARGSMTDPLGNVFSDMSNVGAIDAAQLGGALSVAVAQNANSISLTSSYPGGMGGSSGGFGGTAVSSGGGGGSGYSIGGFLPPPGPIVSDMKLNRRTLTADEIKKIIEQIVVTVKPGERIIVVVDADNDQAKVNELSLALTSCGLDGIVMSQVEVEVFQPEPVTSEFDRIDVLSRLGVIWQENPHFRLGQLIAMALGLGEQSPLWTVRDEDLGVQVEKAYRPVGHRMKKVKP